MIKLERERGRLVYGAWVERGGGRRKRKPIDR